MENLELEIGKMKAFDMFLFDTEVEFGNISPEEIYHSKIGYLRGFEDGFKFSRSCHGCIHEDAKNNGENPEACKTCRRAHEDMHSNFFMEK
jgi:hypothetical protein